MRATNGRIQARTGEHGAPAVQCASGAWSRGAFAYWMCGEGGHCAERCATTRVVSQGNTRAQRMAAFKPGQGSTVRLPCNVPAEQGAGYLCILDARGGRSARGVLRHYACGKPRQHMRATNGRIQARTGERGAPAVQCACGAWSRGSFCILDVRGGAVSARSAVPLRVW